jgi:V8-like Glu-specific endopeptidase
VTEDVEIQGRINDIYGNQTTENLLTGVTFDSTRARLIDGEKMKADVAQSVERVIVPTYDRRKEVEDTLDAPFCAIGYVQATLATPYNYVDPADGSIKSALYTRGSGCLIGKNIVLTAAHNFIDPSGRREVAAIEFWLGVQYDAKTKAATAARKIPAVSIHYPQQYKDNQSSTEDYGLIFLRDCVDGVSFLPETSLKVGQICNVTGFPYDKGMKMMTCEGKVTDIKDDIASYDIDSECGQSGCPLWVERDGQYFVKGVHVRGPEGMFNEATLITDSRLEKIEEWKKETLFVVCANMGRPVVHLSRYSLGNAGIDISKMQEATSYNGATTRDKKRKMKLLKERKRKEE